MFPTGMLWSLWIAMPNTNQTSSSLRSGPSCMGSPQRMPSVLRVNMGLPYIPLNSHNLLLNSQKQKTNVFYILRENTLFMPWAMSSMIESFQEIAWPLYSLMLPLYQAYYSFSLLFKKLTAYLCDPRAPCKKKKIQVKTMKKKILCLLRNLEATGEILQLVSIIMWATFVLPSR